MPKEAARWRPFSADALSALRCNHRLPHVLKLPRGRYRANRGPAWPRLRNCGSGYGTPYCGHVVEWQNEDLVLAGVRLFRSLRGKGICRAPHGGVPQIVARHIPFPRELLQSQRSHTRASSGFSNWALAFLVQRSNAPLSRRGKSGRRFVVLHHEKLALAPPAHPPRCDSRPQCSRFRGLCTGSPDTRLYEDPQTARQRRPTSPSKNFSKTNGIGTPPMSGWVMLSFACKNHGDPVMFAALSD